ncbi:X2-like carbohydrate binding domain-containing protein [Paenibacillus mesophilus]|uniref:X2-like carbohydrate binding domain-containing protein n=1 Tax=Paenibacillus mesophilus TaxID=2582849 RepID=UPI00130525EC|nr:X2-like carbohydrate binding domain-containing protein [Paenibacillus mesophilus]
MGNNGWEFVDGGVLSGTVPNVTAPILRALNNELFAMWLDGPQLKAQKYDGSDWVAVENGLNPVINPVIIPVMNPVMVTANGTLYAAYYQVVPMPNRLFPSIVLKRYDGSAWVTESDTLESLPNPFDMFVYNNELYIAYNNMFSLQARIVKAPNTRTISPTTAEFDKKVPANVSLTMSAYGYGLTSITDGATPLSGTDYTVNGTAVTINSSYLSLLPLGPKTLTFNFGVGTPQTLTVTITDSTDPQITPTTGTFDKNVAQQSPLNVTMATYGKTLSNIADGSTPLVQGTHYNVNGNTVTLNSSYLASLPVGTKVLTFNFSAGAPQTNTITVIDTTQNSIITPTTGTFDKNIAQQSSLNVTIATYGNTLANISDSSTPLVEGAHYNVDGNTVTLNSSYLASLPVGTKALTFNFSAGAPQTYTITVIDTTPGPQNSIITPTSGTFDKNVAQQSPLNVTMATYGNTLSNITDGSTPLVQGTHYSVNGNTVTLSSSYLASLPVGTKALTFNFSAGAPQTYTITVIDTTPGPQNSIITPTSGTFDKNVAQQSPLNVTMAANGNTLSNITDGSTPLVQGTHYSVNGNTITLNTSYLASLPVGTKTLTFNFSAGAPQTYTITVIDTTVGPQNSIITPTSGTFDKNVAQQSPLNVTMAANGNTLSNITDGSTPLVQGTHYSVNGNTITLNTSYLASLPVGTKTLTFNFSAGAPQTYTITVIDTTVNPVPNAPVLVSAVAANRQVTLSWTPVNGATGYKVYQTVTSGTYGSSTPITVGGSVYGYTSTELTNGITYYYVVKAMNNAGDSVASNELSAKPFSAVVYPSGSVTPNSGVNVLVNGKAEQTGTATTTTVNGQSVTTVAIDPAKLQERLDAAGQNAVITIPITTTSDVAVGELNGQMVNNMEKKQAVIEIKTDSATYTIPAEQIDINAISAQLGQNVTLSDIKIQIEIAKPTAAETTVVQNAAKAGEFSLVLPPLEFTVRGVYNGKTFEINKFDAYVERTIAIPDNVDASKITTAIVVDPDGTVRHVPTQIVKIDGKYYAKVNSLTNSIYSLVWHPITFKDAETHWAKDTINNMGSRMIVNGVSNGMFNPDQNMTRAEFAAVIVRGLGLKAESAATSPFKDVKSSDWFSGAVQTAYANGLIGGFEDGTFRPQESITREQAMVIIAKAMKITQLQSKQGKSPQEWTPSTSDFTDRAAIADWATASVEDALKAGLVTGRNGSKLAPKDTVTRAEITVLVQRLLQKSQLIN